MPVAATANAGTINGNFTFTRFANLTGGTAVELPEALQEDAERLEPLAGVKAYPVRVKCATLPWHAFEAALKSGATGATVKTE